MKKTQAEILLELKYPRTQLGNSKEAIQIKWVIQTIGQGLEVKWEDLEQIKKEEGGWESIVQEHTGNLKYDKKNPKIEL